MRRALVTVIRIDKFWLVDLHSDRPNSGVMETMKVKCRESDYCDKSSGAILSR